MKKSKVFVLTLMFAFFGTLTTFANNPISNPNDVRAEIMELVSLIDLSDLKTDSEKVRLQFIVNDKNEVIVLNISESELESTIKNKLNYKTIKTEGVVKNQIYTVPLTFNKK